MGKFLLFVSFLICFGAAPVWCQTEHDPKPKKTLSNWQMIRRFQENSLDSEDQTQTIRLFIVPTFSHPLMVRIDRVGKWGQVTAKMLGGAGGYDAGKLTHIVKKPLTHGQFRQFEQLLQSARIWDLEEEQSAVKTPDGNEVICLDAAEWVMEVRVGGKYRVIARYCPEKDSFTRLGEYMVSASGLRVKPSHLYR